MLLLYLRLLGPTVPRDPLMRPWMAQLSLSQVLGRGWPLLAMLSATRLTTWRSHELPPGADHLPPALRYPLAQVEVPDVVRVLSMAGGATWP